MSDDAIRKQAAMAARGAKDAIDKSGLGNREQGVNLGADQPVKPFDHGLSPVSPISAPAPPPAPAPNEPDRG